MRAAVIAIGLACARTAIADPTEAEQAFQRGHDLMADGKLDEACAAFTDSLRLEYQYGTLYNLGRCEERRGRLLAASRAYGELARVDTNAARRSRAAELAAQLEPRLPKVIIDRAPRPDGFAIWIDNRRITDLSSATAVEVGRHDVVALAPDFEPWMQTITAVEGTTTHVRPVLARRTAKSPPPRASSEPPASAIARRFERAHPVLGVTLTASGAVLLFASVVVAAQAKSLFDNTADAAAAGNRAAIASNHAAVLDGNIATGLVIAGLVALPIGVIVLRRGRWVVVPRVDGRDVSVALARRF
jgi:tetratricopeptide (TPR) repeat protein